MFTKWFAWTALVALCFSATLIGCVFVPPRDGLARVHVGDVVKRIKCDIVQAVFNKAQERTPDGGHPFLFLGNWAAKIHLTIAVDDTVGVNPGATIAHPLYKTVATTLLPATTETFSLGLGVGLTTEAIRTEDYEFLISFPDVAGEFKDRRRKTELYNDCLPENGLLLESDLGLADLIDAALEPVESGVLYQGHNVGPSGTSAVPIPNSQLNNISQQLRTLREAAAGLPKPMAAQSLSEIAGTLSNKSQFNALITKFGISGDTLSKSENQMQLEGTKGEDVKNVQDVKHILANSAEATTEETRTQSIINNIVKPLYAIAASSLDNPCVTTVTKDQFQAITWSADVSVNVIKVNNATDVSESDKDLAAVKAARDKVISYAMNMIQDIKDCKQAVKKQSPTPEYDPVNVISETVNFFVTGSGSVTPAWKLVKVTAPLAPTFLSGSRKDTNTLILAMGRPSAAPNGTLQGSPAMDLQILSAILSQAVRQQPTVAVP